MTEKKSEFKVEEQDKKELEFITRDELLSIISTQDDLKKIFSIQDTKDPSKITQEDLDSANDSMHHLATIGEIFQIAGSLNETTRDFLTRNIAGLFDTLQIQKIILQKLGANPVIEREAVAEYNDIKAKKEKEIKEQIEKAKKGNDEKDSKKDVKSNSPKNVRSIKSGTAHARKARGTKKSKR